MLHVKIMSLLEYKARFYKESQAKNVKNIHVESRDYSKARPSVDIETVSHEIAYQPISTRILWRKSERKGSYL